MITRLFLLLSLISISFAANACPKAIEDTYLRVNDFLMAEAKESGNETDRLELVQLCKAIDFESFPEAGCSITDKNGNQKLVIGYNLEKMCYFIY